jgi:hypothetical protein
MSQVNVNTPGGGGDATGASGVNLVAILAVVIILAVVVWFLLVGPLAGWGGRTTNVTVNPPATAQPAPTVAAPKP